MIEPYEIIDLYVPVASLVPNENYAIKTSFSGGYAIETLVQRSPLTQPSLPDDSDFTLRYGSKLKGQSLKDHRLSTTFRVTSEGLYTDDPFRTIYAIGQDNLLQF